jgi:hypothetical protein
MQNRKRMLVGVSSPLGFSAQSGFSPWHRRQFGSKAFKRRGRDRRQRR